MQGTGERGQAVRTLGIELPAILEMDISGVDVGDIEAEDIIPVSWQAIRGEWQASTDREICRRHIPRRLRTSTL